MNVNILEGYDKGSFAYIFQSPKIWKAKIVSCCKG